MMSLGRAICGAAALCTLFLASASHADEFVAGDKKCADATVTASVGDSTMLQGPQIVGSMIVQPFWKMQLNVVGVQQGAPIEPGKLDILVSAEGPMEPTGDVGIFYLRKFGKHLKWQLSLCPSK